MKNTKEAGPLSVRVIRENEMELVQTDMAWKCSVPFFGTPLELAGYLFQLAKWLERYGKDNETGEK